MLDRAKLLKKVQSLKSKLMMNCLSPYSGTDCFLGTYCWCWRMLTLQCSQTISSPKEQCHIEIHYIQIMHIISWINVIQKIHIGWARTELSVFLTCTRLSIHLTKGTRCWDVENAVFCSGTDWLVIFNNPIRLCKYLHMFLKHKKM